MQSFRRLDNIRSEARFKVIVVGLSFSSFMVPAYKYIFCFNLWAACNSMHSCMQG